MIKILKLFNFNGIYVKNIVFFYLENVIFRFNKLFNNKIIMNIKIIQNNNIVIQKKLEK